VPQLEMIQQRFCGLRYDQAVIRISAEIGLASRSDDVEPFEGWKDESRLALCKLGGARNANRPKNETAKLRLAESVGDSGRDDKARKRFEQFIS
jgi:hypothetical protein